MSDVILEVKGLKQYFPAANFSANKISIEKLSAKEASIEKLSIKEASTKKLSAKEASAQKLSAQNVSAKNSGYIKAVDGVSFRIRRGETFGLVGESGSGKSTIGRSIIRLYDPTDGEIYFNGDDISGKLTGARKLNLRQKMQMIFQDPMASLNPRKKVIDIVAQGLDVHHMYASKKDREDKVVQILEKVGLSREQLDRYPHQFSGGQRQRIGIARALILNPDLVIADEAISALDISIQAQVINMMKDIQEQLGTTYLFIAHDLAMVKHISDYIGVLHLGHLVEMGTKEDIFNQPIHPYTQSLLSAIPNPDPIRERSRNAVKYDYSTSGIDYTLGTRHYIDDTHMVLATDEELRNWMDWR